MEKTPNFFLNCALATAIAFNLGIGTKHVYNQRESFKEAFRGIKKSIETTLIEPNNPTIQTATLEEIPGIPEFPREHKITERAPQKEDSTKTSSLTYAEYIAGWEGRRSGVYDPNPNDGKPEPTIGVGHYLDRGNSRETFARVLPEVNYDKIYSGRKEITKDQIDKLFAHDLKEYIAKTKKAFPKFHTYPAELQAALVDGFYRGDLSGSPKTRRLINEGKWEEASIEYLNNREYLNSRASGMSGVATRMEENSRRMRNYSNKK
jgi:hypothetical protein